MLQICRKLCLCLILALTFGTLLAQQTVLLNISHDKTNLSMPHMLEQYREVVEDALGARLVINKDKEIDNTLLEGVDVLIILSPLTREGSLLMTAAERVTVVDYVKRGGRLIFFTDEEWRVDIDEFGGNDIVRPFGMNFGGDIPITGNTAISFIGEVFSGRHKVPYLGSRELTGGIPISVKNSEGGHVHGAYVKHESGGIIVAFGETMVGLFLGGTERIRPDGSVDVWPGSDNRQFMLELIGWLLEN